MELYPDAKVICTVRDPEAWAKSMNALGKTVLMPFIRVLLFPLPGMQHFPDFIEGAQRQWLTVFGKQEEHDATKTYHAHIENLKRIVPKDRLFFFDVRDGWEPLCKALGKEVPEGIPFPRINDSESIAKQGKKMLNKALLRWAMILGTLALVVSALVYMRRQ